MLCSVHCKSPPSGSLTAAALGELSRRLSVARRALRKQTNEHFYGGWQRLHSKATEQLSHAWCLRDSFYAQRKFIFRFTTTTTTMPDDDASRLYNICIEYVSGMDRRPATCYSPRNAIWFSCRCVDVRRLQFSHSSFIPIYAVIHKSHGSWRNVPVSSGVWIELILTASAACVRSLCSIYWWSWNHIFLQLWQSNSLEGNFRFSTEDNILLMSAVNIQAHGTQNDKIKIMWIRLGPHAGKPSYGNNVCVCVLREISVSIVRADVPMCVAAGMRTWTHCARN